MNAKEFIFIRKIFGLTQKSLAEILSLSIQAIQSYEQDVTPVPGLVAKVMRSIYYNAGFAKYMLGKKKHVKVTKMYRVVLSTEKILEAESMNEAVRKFKKILRPFVDSFISDDYVEEVPGLAKVTSNWAALKAKNIASQR